MTTVPNNTSAVIGVSFDGAKLIGRTLGQQYVGVSFNNADLTNARLTGEFINVSMRSARLDGARLTGSFTNVSFQGTGIMRDDLADARSVSKVTLHDGSAYSRS